MSKTAAYYVNGNYVPEGRSLQGVRVESAEYLPIKEDATPTTLADETYDETQVREGDSHRIKKTVRKKTEAELEAESAIRAKEGELAYWKATQPLFESGNVTQEMRDNFTAYQISLL